jgi:glutaredoxin
MTTKTKDKFKKSVKSNIALKKEVKNELKAIEEAKRLERVKANSNLREVTIYTQSTCPHCNNLKSHLEKEGIKFIEKEIMMDGVREEFNNVTSLTGMGVFPVTVVNGNYFVPGRDYSSLDQLTTQITHYGNPNFDNYPTEERIWERIKGLESNMGNSLQHLHSLLTPIQEFISNIQKEIAEEEKGE